MLSDSPSQTALGCQHQGQYEARARAQSLKERRAH
jgi:hypothetical protein